MNPPAALTIRQGQPEQACFEQLKAELVRAFRAPDDIYRPLTAAEIIASNASTDGAPLSPGEGARRAGEGTAESLKPGKNTNKRKSQSS